MCFVALCAFRACIRCVAFAVLHVVRCGSMWYDVVRCCSMVRCGTMWYDVVRCGLMWLDVTMWRYSNGNIRGDWLGIYGKCLWCDIIEENTRGRWIVSICKKSWVNVKWFYKRKILVKFNYLVLHTLSYREWSRGNRCKGGNACPWHCISYHYYISKKLKN
jgi:hypothetical protein